MSRTNTKAEPKGLGELPWQQESVVREGRGKARLRDLGMRTGNPCLLRSKVHQGAFLVPYLFVALGKSLSL